MANSNGAPRAPRAHAIIYYYGVIAVAGHHRRVIPHSTIAGAPFNVARNTSLIGSADARTDQEPNMPCEQPVDVSFHHPCHGNYSNKPNKEGGVCVRRATDERHRPIPLPRHTVQPRFNHPRLLRVLLLFLFVSSIFLSTTISHSLLVCCTPCGVHWTTVFSVDTYRHTHLLFGCRSEAADKKHAAETSS